MALTSTNSLSVFYGEDKQNESAFAAFEAVMAADWNSAGLPHDNAFTTIIAIRTAGILASARVADSDRLLGLRRTTGPEWKDKTLGEIADLLLTEFPSKLAIEAFSATAAPSYPPTAALAYWFVDGITNLGIDLKPDQLAAIADWARDTLVREVSLLSSNHDALMDPIELAMSAALAWRLTGPQKPLHAATVRATLPSSIEITHAVSAFIGKQLPSGLWPKYFPLFHFPAGGANYCWSFEVLEALLLEMDRGFPRCETADIEVLLTALGKGVAWCIQNRLTYDPEGSTKRTGWNSGGNILSLRAGLPELWPTGVVHMFSHRVENLVSRLIQRELEHKYNAQPFVTKTDSKWDSILDFDLSLLGETTRSSVKGEIDTQIAQPILGARRQLAKSALLFGPPGTSKTTLVKALAQRIGWSYIELSPNDFLRDGLPNIYSRSGEIFDDLADLKKVVILFDEMDALARTREDEGGVHPLDVTQQFLTTSMLPNLARLHDQADIVFFMATNFQSRFDAAIKRPGRFDLLLLVGPPSWSRKIIGIGSFWKTKDAVKLAAIQKLLREWAPDGTALARQLDDFTFGELSAFFGSLLNEASEKDDLYVALKVVGEARFSAKVRKWHTEYIALRPQPRRVFTKARDNELTRYQEDLNVSRRQ